MMNLRILMVTPMPPQAQAPGAIPVVLHAQLSGLRERHAVTLVTVVGKEPGEQQAVQQLLENGVDVHAVSRQELHGWSRWQRRWRMGKAWLTRRLPWRTIWFWEPQIQHILDHLLTSQQFDLVVVEDNAMGIYDFHTSAPLIFTEHEVRRPRKPDFRFWKRSSLAAWVFSEVEWQRWQAYHRFVWQKFDHIQVFSTRDADAVHEIAPDLHLPVSVNPFGIVLPPVPATGREQDKRLLFVGNYTHAPNVDAALWLGREIMPRLITLCPGVQLDLVGIYPPTEVKALESDSIHVTGHVQDITPYMEEAAVVLAPVRIGGGMRMKVLHSLAMSKPVVTTSRGADGLRMWGTPPLKIADDAEEFAQATASLLSDVDARRELGTAARAFVAEYLSPQAYVNRLESAYANMRAQNEQPERSLYGA